jgi:hypothetical protein
MKQNVPMTSGRFSAKQLVRRIQNQQVKTSFDEQSNIEMCATQGTNDKETTGDSGVLHKPAFFLIS